MVSLYRHPISLYRSRGLVASFVVNKGLENDAGFCFRKIFYRSNNRMKWTNCENKRVPSLSCFVLFDWVMSYTSPVMNYEFWTLDDVSSRVIALCGLRRQERAPKTLNKNKLLASFLYCVQICKRRRMYMCLA